jgi:hypothetical protein
MSDKRFSRRQAATKGLLGAAALFLGRSLVKAESLVCGASAPPEETLDAMLDWIYARTGHVKTGKWSYVREYENQWWCQTGEGLDLIKGDTQIDAVRNAKKHIEKCLHKLTRDDKCAECGLTLSAAVRYEIKIPEQKKPKADRWQTIYDHELKPTSPWGNVDWVKQLSSENHDHNGVNNTWLRPCTADPDARAALWSFCAT